MGITLNPWPERLFSPGRPLTGLWVCLMNDNLNFLARLISSPHAAHGQGHFIRGATLWLACLLILMPVLPVAASPSGQTPPPATTELEGVESNNSSVSNLWTAFNQSTGLISNNVTAILVQKDVIWFSTDAGISRFDGRWTSFQSGVDLPTGRNTLMTQIGADQEIWIGTNTGFLSRWDGEKWQLRGDLGVGLTSLAQVDDQIWVGTGSGIMVWTPVAAADLAADPVALGSAVALGDLQALPADLRDTRITALAQGDAEVYVGTEDGLWIWDHDEWTRDTVQNGLPSSDITAIWISPEGAVWVGAKAGAARRLSDTSDTVRWRAFPTVNIDGQPTPVLSLQGDNQGIVWAGSESGAYQFTEDNRTLQLPGDVGLTTAYVQAVAPDQDGQVWLGTVAGVFRFSKDTWIFEHRNDVQPEADGSTTYYLGINYINALLVDSRNALWVATNGAGVRFKVADVSFSDEIYYTEANSNLPSNLVKALAEDAQGDIWAGTQDGVARIHDNRWIVDISPTALPSPDVLSLATTPTGMWVGTEGGLAFYTTATGALTQIDSFADRPITALAQDGLGRLWVGTRDQGLFLEQPDGSFGPGPQPQALMGLNIVSLAQDQSNADGIWAGIFQQGIDHWDGQKWNRLTSAQGLPSSVVHGVYTSPDELGVWIGSEAGVTRFDGRSWGTFEVKEGELSPSIMAVARSQSGGMWFGGRDGLTFYLPDKTPPWVKVQALTGLTVVASTPDFASATLELGSDPLQVTVAAGDLHTNQEDLAIIYRWNGGPQADSVWKEMTGRQIDLPVAAPGTYLFELGARDKAFNYAPYLQSTFEIQRAASLITLPVIGVMRVQTFQILLTLGLIATMAFAYVASGIVQGQRRRREAMVRGYNPYISGEPVRREDMFFGREDLLQRIIDSLHNNSIMIHGERRIGKTTLLYQLGNRLREVNDPEFWFVPVFADLEGTPQETFFHFLMEEIVVVVRRLPEATDALLKALDDLDVASYAPASYSDRDFSRDLRDLLQALTAYGAIQYPGRKSRLILLLDEMDVMSHYDHLVQQQLRRIFMRDFATTLGAVVAGIQISKAWDRVESPWYNLFNEIELEPFGREQAAELLTRAVQDYYTYDQSAVEAIIDYSDGRPFRLQQYGLVAVNQMLSEGRRRVTMADVEVAHVTIQEQIGRNGVEQWPASHNAIVPGAEDLTENLTEDLTGNGTIDSPTPGQHNESLISEDVSAPSEYLDQVAAHSQEDAASQPDIIQPLSAAATATATATATEAGAGEDPDQEVST